MGGADDGVGDGAARIVRPSDGIVRSTHETLLGKEDISVVSCNLFKIGIGDVGTGVCT
jgi:hypothetical protein